MKARMNIRSIIMVMATIGLASMFFINICFATSTGKITTETARLREQPNTEAKVLELASLGEEVEILEEIDGWYKVKYKKITGYIRNDLVETINQIQEEMTNNTEINQNTLTEIPVENTEVTTTPVIEDTPLGKRKLLDNVKLKIVPLISAEDIGEVNIGTEVEVTEVLNNWAKIKTVDGKEGWVVRRKTTTTGELFVLFGLIESTPETRPEDTKTETQQETQTTESQTQNTKKTMYVNSQTINVRQEPNTTSKIIKQLPINQEVTVISNENGWYKVEIDGNIAYISQSLLSDEKQETSRGATTERPSNQNITTQNINNAQKEETKPETIPNQTPNTATSEKTDNGTINSNKGEEIVAYAKQFLGHKYVYGGTTPNGFDCSGFTQYVYRHFGININRTAAAQYSNGISVTNLQAGDLVMFGKSGIDHVGIYIGGNIFIHAANSRRGVTTDTLASGYYKTNYVGARRVL